MAEKIKGFFKEKKEGIGGKRRRQKTFVRGKLD
jgi:hypothetical protein